MWACKTKELGNVFLSFFSYLSCIYNSTALYKFYIKTNQSGKLVWMELFNLSFLNSFCCNSLVHLMVDTKQKHWKQYIDLNVIQSLAYMSLRFNFFRLHNLLDFDTAIMRFAFPYHAFTWQCGIARSLSSLSLSLSSYHFPLSHT